MKIKTLTEAYSPSMPSWLKWVMKYNRNVSPEGYIYEVDSTFRQRLSKEIDVSSANFIEVENPSTSLTSRDPRVKAPNIGFFLITTDIKTQSNGNEVEVVVVNSPEFLDDKVHIYVGSNYDFVSVKYTSMKQLISHAIAYCYVDGSESGAYKQKLAQKDEIARNMDYSVEKNPYDNKHDSRLYKGFRAFKRGTVINPSLVNTDKSGYLILNPQRYEKALQEVHAKELYKELDKIYDMLLEYKQEIVKIAREGSEVSNVTELLYTLRNYIYEYNNTQDYVRRALTEIRYTPEARKERLTHLYNSAVKLRKDLERGLSVVSGYEVDWE